MEVTYGQQSETGPVRPHNEDTMAFWQADTEDERRRRGVIALLADGVGGQGFGEVASKLAVKTALKIFQDSEPGAPLNGLVWQMFNAANIAVYDAGMAMRASEEGRMGTTLTVTIFRNNEIAVGHVGDSRCYLVQGGKIRRMTNDHTHVAFHMKMGLFSPSAAHHNPLRHVLTRVVGQEPTINVDYSYAVVHPGDFVIQCCDGVHVYLTDHELMDRATRKTPAEACADVLALALSRGTDDNISAQICRIEKVYQLTFYRGAPVYAAPVEKPASHEIDVGQVLDKRFEITGLISRSGMASIFKAFDQQTRQNVAIKIPFMQYESDAAFYTRFLREESIGLAMNHPYIMHLVPVKAEQKSRPYIVMELLDGETLDQVMARERPMALDKAVRIAIEICQAMTYMHGQKIIHRDLKPQNIMICRDGTIRIMDFGIARSAGMRRLTFTGFTPAMGTPDYMAPEQVKGKRGDERTDIYSLGAILYEMATGSVPFEAANPFLIMNARVTGDPKAPTRLNAKISPQLEEMILHAMERNPAQRYPTAEDFRRELEQPEQVKVTGRADHLQEPVEWNPTWWKVRLITAAICMAAVAFMIFLIWRAHH
jgi:serine/threonine protein phosphatase PrpC